MTTPQLFHCLRLALLERIIKLTTNPGAVVLDS